jgi:proteasome beta subunit
MIRGNLALAFQGLVVVPLFCGFDEIAQTGRLFSFDIVGGRYDELNYATTGSGGAEAKSFLKSEWQADLSRDEALALAVEALIAASEEDAATGGPDIRRGIYPNIVTVTKDGVEEVNDEKLKETTAAIVETRP